MWRKKGEANLPRLAGANEYEKQVPISRSIPLWGGLSENGFAPVQRHLDSKKTNKEKWSQEVRNGALTAALRSVNRKKKTRPWTILCDGESFLQADMSMSAYRSKRIQLWVVPPKSPDLNPVEMFWSWLLEQAPNDGFSRLACEASSFEQDGVCPARQECHPFPEGARSCEEVCS